MISQKITSWVMEYGKHSLAANAPCSLYSVLLEHKIIEDPFYRLNEKGATALSEKDMELSAKIYITAEMLEKKHIDLCFYGIDTLCDVYLGGEHLFYADNMHRTWRADVKNKVCEGENELRLHFYSPSEYIKRKNAEHYLYTSTAGGAVMEGTGHIRKSSCMFGWDWGPQLPDMGLYRDAFIEAYDARIDDIAIRQVHEAGKVKLLLSLLPSEQLDGMGAQVTVTSPDGREKEYPVSLERTNEIEIENPRLWWPNGLGGQPLYTLRFALTRGGETLDTAEKRIGLRTMTVSRDKDEYGEEFCACVNGVKFFSMGADYVPEDSILPHRTRERTEELIRACREANFNSVRVWGGGYYPDDCFYDICDEYGIVVWQDFMFACMNVLMTEEFEKNVRAEFCDVLKRIRHHASIGLLCGNNEMELALIEWSTCLRSKTQKVVDDYLLLYEKVIPEVCAEYAPDIFYWPASPSSHGGFDDPNSENVGDAHYWKVWHGGVPFEEYRKHYFRYCSEFGFEAFPSVKTLESFALPSDMRIDSEVMRSHQKCLSGNEKIMSYVKDYYRIPEKFEDFVYISQLLQADAIRYGAEHFRRYRGRCMGALYWQLNDCWPTVSWASVAYFGRWKALHHKAKGFFAPVLLSLHEEGEVKIANISNETRNDFEGEIHLAVRDASFRVIAEWRENVYVSALSSKDFAFPEEISGALCGKETELFLEYALICGGEDVCREAKIYAKPKDYRFENPQISANLREETGEFYLDLCAEKLAKSVMLEWQQADVRAEENFFDITNGSKSVRIFGEREAVLSEMPKIVSVYDVQ